MPEDLEVGKLVVFEAVRDRYTKYPAYRFGIYVIIKISKSTYDDDFTYKLNHVDFYGIEDNWADAISFSLEKLQNGNESPDIAWTARPASICDLYNARLFKGIEVRHPAEGLKR